MRAAGSAPQKTDAGITVTFVDRKVVDAVVTELSDDAMRSSFKHGGGFVVDGHVIELPKVPIRTATARAPNWPTRNSAVPPERPGFRSPPMESSGPDTGDGENGEVRGGGGLGA